MTKHQFALHCPTGLLLQAKPGNMLHIHEQALVHRIKHVVRMQQDQTCILFDAQVQVLCIFKSADKKSVSMEVISCEQLVELKPHVTVLLPLLKKEAQEQALYTCTELGANSVRLVMTDKTQRTWSGDKDLARLRNIMIAAAEQSKNFVLPELYAPCALADAIQEVSGSYALCANVAGDNVITVANDMLARKPKTVTLIVGPEGDFVAQEYQLLTQHKFVACALTPTVLKSEQALTVLLGIVRSALR
jgi:16S rRNA (uracil1498-N3)-methyltransferase